MIIMMLWVVVDVGRDIGAEEMKEMMMITFYSNGIYTQTTTLAGNLLLLVNTCDNNYIL